MAEPKDLDSLGSKDKSQNIEDVGECHIASSVDHSSDSCLVEKEEERIPEEERGNEDVLEGRTEIEEQLDKISIKDSPKEEDHKEPCCTEVDCTPPLKSVKERDIDDCIYHLKWIVWHDRKAPIVTQNENGPCPLIAISNILLLKGKIMLPSAMEIITAKQLMEYIGDMILQNVPKNLTLPRQLNYEQNMHDAIAVLPRLHTGLDVNVKFTGVQDFEYTPECIIFDLLNITLYHGWLVDPQCHDTVNALGSLGYNQIVEKIILNKCSSEIDLVTEALVAEEFLERTASQLTYHGLCELNTAMGHDELAVLFRNNHFSTIFKKKVCGPVDEASSSLLGMSQELNELFQLVTDQGFLHEPRVVWETLSNIEGDGMFVDGRFVTVPPKASGPYRALAVDASEDQQINHDYLVALSLQEDQKKQQESEQAWEEFKQMQEITSDEELSHHLHEDEQRHVQNLVPVAAMLHGHTRPYAHAQPTSGDRNKKGSVLTS
ncbi:ubiquitin carboxyl-terminal hydrolase MINDY-2-like isoform X2 [Zootermopsis nevadensis]|uniref:ubiquitin carboxyl-terminal hydrolase MINDY-2-like isoform X2 n=1 Tax=Zootermopsis nevadensis TaxID=136037 RepID=UPI000B8EAFF2|nr:ubiquitin carboxyl-terminal hydrolase MINDY-2-like isoform X2 [Zootermopsis nevadensis]